MATTGGRMGTVLLVCCAALLIAGGAVSGREIGQTVDNIKGGRGGVPVDVQSSNEAPWFCHGIDCPDFVVDESFIAVENVERRIYSATKWVSKRVKGISYDKAVYDGFMSLFRYISGSNENETKIPMTAPVRNKLIPAAGPTCENDFVISFFVPFAFQESTPAPTEEGVYLEEEEPFVVYVKTYGGFSGESKVISNAAELAGALLDAGVAIEENFYFSAGYDPPFRLFKRHNEVWIMEARKTGAVSDQK